MAKNFQVHRNKAFKGINIFEKGVNPDKSKEKYTKSQKLMNGVGIWTSYYRYFPHIFVEEFIGFKLKLFQQVLIFFMMHYNYFIYLAARG